VEREDALHTLHNRGTKVSRSGAPLLGEYAASYRYSELRVPANYAIRGSAELGPKGSEFMGWLWGLAGNRHHPDSMCGLIQPPSLLLHVMETIRLHHRRQAGVMLRTVKCVEGSEGSEGRSDGRPDKANNEWLEREKNTQMGVSVRVGEQNGLKI